ncbi:MULTISPECIES: hypothetical protein [unclassified Microcoleus]|uniref:hypothetical protein n=1 Tax=unclassified Microcoleus TaxID=2642155 RepID=UPI002FD2239B
MTLFNPSSANSQQQPAFSNSGTTSDFSLTTATTTIASDRTAAKNRRGLVLFNDGTANALFNYGTTISATTFTAELLPGGYFEDTTGWQGPMVARAANNATSINVAEIVII